MPNYFHLDIQPLAEGVWAAMATDQGSAACNAGIIDLGDHTLVVDTHATLAAAAELRAAAMELTGRPASLVVNTHFHPDHIHGNKVFDGEATLIASEVTRSVIAEQGLMRMERFRRQLEGQRADVVRQLEQATDPAKQAELAALVREFDTFFEAYPTPADLRVPTLTFERTLTLHGARRTARLITWGAAHSPCDTVVWLPAERICFVGDMVVSGNQIVVDGAAERWPGVLDQLEALGPERLVQGHGPVTPAAEGIALARRYLADLMRVAEEALAAGETPDYADRIAIPEGIHEYWYRRNIRFLLERKA